VSATIPLDPRKTPALSVIVARAANGVIGNKGGLPWHIPNDLKHFKSLTMGHPIIMGRKTWESIGRPLPGRRNIVVSRQDSFAAPGAQVVTSLQAAMDACRGEVEVFVIGGEQLYRQALPRADRLYLTEIGREFEGDTKFPELRPDDWLESDRVAVSDDPSGVPISYVTLQRRKQSALR
jgi:dihydrofolate reductase